jgi:hypothetical protein
MSPSPSATAFSALLAFLDLDLENADAALVVLNPDRSEARVVRAECRGGGFRRAKGDGSGRRPLQVAEAGMPECEADAVNVSPTSMAAGVIARPMTGAQSGATGAVVSMQFAVATSATAASATRRRMLQSVVRSR